MEENNILQFAPWQSAVVTGFWERLANLKLDHAKLNEDPCVIKGFFTPSNHDQLSSPLSLTLESIADLSDEASDNVAVIRSKNFCVPGSLINFNTLEKFKELNKGALLRSVAQQVWDDIKSGSAAEDPSLLNRFVVVTFADLKKWNFFYWFAFPGLVLPQPVRAAKSVMASSIFTANEVAKIQEICERRRLQIETSILSTETSAESSAQPAFLLHLLPSASVTAHPLTAWQELQQEGQEGQVILAVWDPSHHSSNPGWPLRNLLAFVAATWHTSHLTVVCLRDRKGRLDLQHSPLFHVQIPEPLRGEDCPPAVGWEANPRGKSGPRLVDLAPSMDPSRLAMAAADLNLKLMRWRLLPSLNLSLMADTKCLILGAGTLGCQIARGLMAWGVRNITFVDNGRVAMSNPLRQSLYAMEDCLQGGALKAEAAAASLKKIYPHMRSRGVVLSIPMPGHPVHDSQHTLRSCDTLLSLVEEHQCVFLATDTRESRWLPTLLCTATNTLAINTALGFDSYLVMRHGCAPEPVPTPASTAATSATSGVGSDRRGVRLGCYFCSDVVAPLDSTTNRSLDQQCTVSRPGLAPVAAALGVELAVNVLHHPQGISAIPTDQHTVHLEDKDVGSSIGSVPHQIRGFFTHFTQMCVTGFAFDSCTACSLKVVNEYKRKSTEFLLRVFNEPQFLEVLTGISELLKGVPEDMTWDSDDDELEI